MTTAKTPKTFRLPDPPEYPEDKMTNFDQLSVTGSAHHLMQHLGNPETTLVAGERYLVVRPSRSLMGSRYPDLLIAFDADPVAYRESNGYIIEEQGKPPDFVLEIASRRTGRVDVADKRKDYADLGIPEYWRFDETGNFHQTRLAGDRLGADGQYHPVAIEELADGVLRGYSLVLNLFLVWEHGQLRWLDPHTGRHIATFEDERAARIQAQAEAQGEREARFQEREARLQEREARLQEQEARFQEQEARLAAEARVRELEERLRDLGEQ